MKNKIFVIVGPTASGKTDTAFELARQMNGEIISCDSMQVYKEMPIVTQMPPLAYLKAIPHHMISKIPPEEEYSAAGFVNNAKPLIEGMIEKGKIPIIVGGTGLYVKALIDGLFPSPPKDERFRKKMEDKVKKHGPAALHEELKRKDPDTAKKIHSNDIRRIIRALEILELTGIPMSEHKPNTRGIAEEYEIILLGLNMPRKYLYEKINDRIEKMFKDGVVEEVRQLLKKHKLSKTAGSALGIKELSGYIKRQYGLKEAVELLKRNTRRYAKKQLTWFRSDKRIRWFDEGKSLISYCRHI